MAPEHPLVANITTPEQNAAVENYVKESQKKSDVERQESKNKTGVFTGSYALNPANGEKVPIWIADYVLVSYGTGAIMAVCGQRKRRFGIFREETIANKTVCGATQRRKIK